MDQNINVSSRELLFLNQMKAFCEGKWQKEMPQKEGVFIVANYKGEIHRNPVVVYPAKWEYRCIPPHESWWWSEPIPDNFGLPPPPVDSE